ncbi:MAG: hypothetical protein II640_03800, partial [Lachnospiraceae bacterium]|nr:hypothetical protein [Lachnospiraceae bacterium]
GITLDLVYGDGGDPLIQSVDLGSGWQDYDDEQSVYDLCAEGPYGEAVRLRFLKDGQRTSVPVCVDGEYPALGEYLIWAEVIPQGDDVTPGQSFSKAASLTLTIPESELLTAGSRIDLEMDSNESRVFRIEVPSEEVPQEHAFMLWQEPGDDSISYLVFDAFRISEDGSFSIPEGSEGVTLQNWQWNASKLRLSSGQTLYLRIRHPETSGSDSYRGTLCLDPFLTVQNITLIPKETPLSAGSMLLDSRREWLTAEVTWSDGSSSPVSVWNRRTVYLGGGTDPVAVLYQDSVENNKEPLAVAFRENGSFIDAPDVDEIPLGRTFDLVPFISDRPEDMESLSDHALEGLTFTLGTEMKELVPGQSTQLWADGGCCHLASYTAVDDGEYFAEASGNGRSLKVYVFTSDDEGVNYRCCASGESPSFFLKEGETVILAASNDFSTRMSCNMTLSEKLPLSGVTLYDSEGTVFDAGYDGDGGCLADRIRMNFVYGEGDDGISQTVSLTGGGTDYDENNVAFCYGYGPYGEYVSIFFLDDEGNRIDAPQMNGSYLPEAGTYPVMAVLNWTDTKTGEERELTSNAVFTLGVPAFTQLSLTKAASYNIPVDGRAFFSCTAQKAGRYSFSLPTSSIFRYRFGWFERTDEGRIRLIDNGWVDTNGDSSGSAYADLEQGETVYLVLRSDEDGRSAKGSIQLTKIREIENAVLSVNQNRLYTFDTFTREPDFLEAVCTDEMGDSRTIREWGLDEVEIGDRQYTVMCGSDEGTEQIGVIFKEGDDYIDYPFTYRIPADTDYTLQAFRMSDPEGIDTFAAQSPDIELSFRGSEQVTEVFADTPFAHDPAGPAEDWLLFTAPSDGEYYFSTSDNWTEFRLFQEEEDGYSYENGYQRTCTYTLHEGENRIICVLWDDPDNKGLEFTVTKVRKIVSVELSEVTAQIPALSPTYEQIGVSLRYEGEETPWQADRLYYDSGDLLTEGRFGEEIYISFYDMEGEQLDGIPCVGQKEWDDSEDDEVTRFEPGQWLISATADMYDPEQERYVQVESEKKPFVQVPAEFTQMTPGDRKKFSITSSSAGYFRFMAEEECCYRYWAEDCGSYLEAHRFTLDESGVYTYRDYDYLYDNLEDPSYFRTLDMSPGEPVYVLLGVDTEDEDQAARVAGWLCVDLETGLTEAAVQGAIPLKNGYTGAVSMKRGGEQYYSFLPDPEDPDRKPGEYIFVNDLEGQMDLELYARYGSSWILQESLCEEDVYDGKEVLSRYYDEGEE